MNPIHIALTTTLLLVATIPQSLMAQDPSTEAAEPPANYVVHEWGTFTSMAGTSGTVLEGLHHEEEHLPAFVHDLMKVTETGETTGTKLPASYVTQKMETPVIYFYADEPMQAEVDVWFQKGLMTQFYPLPTAVYPRIGDARKRLVDMRTVKGSSLSWNIDILPRTANADVTPPVPEVRVDDPWHFARQTNSNLVRTRPRAGSPAKAETEHYLFYRGLGRWQPDVTVAAKRGEPVCFGNDMPHAMPFAMTLELGEQGGRFVVGDPIAGNSAAAFDLANAEWQPDRERFARRIGANMLQALVAQGLYTDEARAMVATWSRSWFQTDGTRVIYLLPRQILDAVLPLSLDPKPRELVRVMVGRHEFITPAAQDTVEQALRQQASADPASAAAAKKTLAHLDRFLEPHLRNIAENGSTPASKRAAEAMLAQMTQ